MRFTNPSHSSSKLKSMMKRMHVQKQALFNATKKMDSKEHLTSCSVVKTKLQKKTCKNSIVTLYCTELYTLIEQSVET